MAKKCTELGNEALSYVDAKHEETKQIICLMLSNGYPFSNLILL